MPKTLRGMTARELLAALQELPEDQLDQIVVHQSNYGDYSRTQQALPILAIETGHAEESAYSNSDFAVADLEQDCQDALDDGEFETMAEEHEARLAFLNGAETSGKYTPVVILKMRED